MNLNELLQNLPIDEIARSLGTDSQTATQAVGSALPALLKRIQTNASSGGADSLGKALQNHNNDLARSGKIQLAKVDTRDGEKIIGHVFGEQPQQVAAKLGAQQPQADNNILGQLLPMLAPIAMSFLANNVLGGGNDNNTQKNLQQSNNSNQLDLGGLLGSILGGGQPQQGQQQQQSGGLDLGSIIGGLFGKRNG